DTIVTVTNSTFEKNATQGLSAQGGAIFADAGTVNVNNSTIADNSTLGFGGGIYVAVGTATLHSSIVAHNHDSVGPTDLVATTTPPFSLTASNRFNSMTATGLIPDGNGNLIGSDSNPLDPMLGPLQNNGGPTQTMALLPGSPAIDPGGNPLSLTSDQRGFPFARVVGGEADMGAFELQTVLNLVVTSAADRLDTTFDPNNLTLRDALTEANTYAGPDTITFAPSLNGVPIQLSLGELPIKDAVTIRGLGAAHTTIDAQHNSRIFGVSSSAGDVTLDGLTLTGGGTTDQFFGGGAIAFNSPCTLSVQNSILTGNSSAGLGGAIANDYYGNVSVDHSTFSGNSTTGAAAYGGAIFSRSSVRITNSTGSGNFTQGAGAAGGGIFTRGAELINSTVANNYTQGTGAHGGGIFSADNPVTVTNSTVAGNSTRGSNAFGGGLFDAGGNAGTHLVTLTSS